MWPASEWTGVVIRVESEAGREKRDGAPREEERDVVEVLECTTGVFVERIPVTTTEVRGDEFGV